MVSEPWYRLAALALPLLVTLAGCEPEPPFGGLSRATRVEANPHNALSCTVRWDTDEAASSWIHVEPNDGRPAFAVGSDALVEEHEVVVIGLRSKQNHKLWTHSETADGAVVSSEELAFTTGPLPFETPRSTVVARDPGRMQPGWTLMNLVVDSTFPPTIAVMLDDEGEVVWYHTLGEEQGASGVQVSMVAEDQVLIGGNIPPGARPRQVTLSGELVWEGPMQLEEGLFLAGTMHHTFQRLPSGDYVTLLFEMVDGHLQDVIWQFDEALQTTWEWHASDHIPEADEIRLHGNIVQIDEEQGVAYFNARDTRSVYKIDQATDEILWTLGEGGDFTVLGDHPDPWFLQAHAAEILPDGHLLIHDNGSSVLRPYSRIMEYAIDEEAMTVEPVWQYPPEGSDDTWFAMFWGDADRLPNGNTLFCSGSAFQNDSSGRIVELAPDGEIVWDLRLEAMDGGPAAPYMLERIAPLVLPL